ncbi:ABC transporter ATP-binding protein [Bradyrhizobium sp. WYCCWR 13022]|uniref:ABC transporter ATP-binding protein n=1 Tax=unclassified Bradyrhizobium TaxID=2631580 RepID=UPI00263A6CA0|nr:ABC transporter ATP-binding protein [Bradyrhizobium sp. WYCCWR 13022]MDN4984317.1 ABC transporter ATP-binding protein [Bradyrhizobium sp. WYCCWR 13022]
MTIAGAREVLSVEKVGIRFGGVVALDDVSFAIRADEILGLIGPNGAGKTTLFNCLSRLYQPTSGDIQIAGQSLLNLRPHEIVRHGIGRTFQNVSLFHNLSVFDNIRIGCHSRGRRNVAYDIFALPAAAREEREVDARILEIAEFLDLLDCGSRKVVGLPFGTQKRVELARALASQPKLLLLDEPAGGLNHEEVYALGDLIKKIRDRRGVTILLVEHHMGLVMSIADRIVALNFGKKLAEGTPSEIQANPEVIKAYLGDGGR